MSLANHKTLIHAVVTEELKRWLTQRAEEQNRSLSNFIGVVLEQARQLDVERKLSAREDKPK